jgi:2-oxoglutarate ferredoxin oxidoreductase subunit alpha
LVNEWSDEYSKLLEVGEILNGRGFLLRMKESSSKGKSDISIVLCGQAGQGIQTVEVLLTRILKTAGCNVFSTKEYMSRVRGGANSTEIRVSNTAVRAYVNRIDILVPLNKGAVKHVSDRISPETIILADEQVLSAESGGQYNLVNIPFNKIATDLGNIVYSNVVATGAIAALFRIELQTIVDNIKQHFSTKTPEIIKNNTEAAQAGFKIGSELLDAGRIVIDGSFSAGAKSDMFLNGAEAVSLGSIAGGCNFIAAYPMSPSTPVLVFLSQHADRFHIIAEQAEDEIAAMNMAVGAWYAGARALASTSGGGFALMIEGLSLAGMLESPVVVHLAQRPAPATGLPTRTEQADLELALYAGHGEFPRIIFAPGKLEDAFYLTQRAFNLTDKYQVPVFVLTDQYFIDSYYNIPPFDLSDIKVEKHIIKTGRDYKRYELTESGISPRGIPGYGEGLVVVDSDEHDEEGHITEDLQLRTKMVDKRLRKLELIKEEIIPPELWPEQDYKTIVVCWGSTYYAVREALERLARKDVSLLHYKQVYPLHPSTADYLKRAQKIVIVENNATSQFGKLIKLYTGIDIQEKILKYNGLSFSVEEIAAGLEKILD